MWTGWDRSSWSTVGPTIVREFILSWLGVSVEVKIIAGGFVVAVVVGLPLPMSSRTSSPTVFLIDQITERTYSDQKGADGVESSCGPYSFRRSARCLFR